MTMEAKTKERLTKKEITSLWHRYMWFNNGCTNFQNFYGNGWAWCLRPLFEKYYNKEDVIKSMQGHCWCAYRYGRRKSGFRRNQSGCYPYN